MKICWDTLEGLRYSKKTGKWYKKNYTYMYRESCSVCKKPYLTGHNSKYCDRSCALTGKNHPMYGKKHTKTTQKKMSLKQSGSNNPNWKGGVEKRNLPLFKTYAHQIDWCESVRRSKKNKDWLEVKCKNCNQWCQPSKIQVRRRIQSILGQLPGECNLYCSKNCKQECTTHWSTTIPKDKRKVREVQPDLRQMVFKRDEWTCQKCGQHGGLLHCHHITGIEQNPIESADIDNCITFCKECHLWIHKNIPDCGYNELRCK